MHAIHKKLQKLSVLIVEDDQSTLKWLEKILSIYFKEIKTASNAMDALELFQKNLTDVVISDIQMPQVDGLNFLHKIAFISPKTLRVVMTAFNSPEYLNRAVQSEVNLYLKKPIDIDELLVTIASNIKEYSQNQSLVDIGENYFYDSFKKVVIKNTTTINLTKKEILLLELLIKNNHTIVTIEEIENNVWKESVTPDAIRMVIVGIRKKIYSDFIINIKGFGYRLNKR